MVRQAPSRERSVQYVKGVGPARAQLLKRLGVESVDDLFFYVPRRYEDRRQFAAIAELVPGQTTTVHGRILATSLKRLRGGRTLFETVVGDASGTVTCLWFNQPYLNQQLHADDELVVYGRVDPNSPRRRFVHPEIERLGSSDEAETPADQDEAMLHMGRIVPIYPLTARLGQRWFRQVMRSALRSVASMRSQVPLEAIARQGLRPLTWSIQQIHFPESLDSLGVCAAFDCGIGPNA